MRFGKMDIVWAIGGAAAAYLALWAFGIMPAIPRIFLDSASLAVTAIATVVVACLTVTLARVGRQQVVDTRILQRAYLSANIGGISPFRTIEEREGHIVVAHVDITNVGHLPARRVSCCIKIVQSENGEFADFPIDEQDFLVAMF